MADGRSNVIAGLIRVSVCKLVVYKSESLLSLFPVAFLGVVTVPRVIWVWVQVGGLQE